MDSLKELKKEIDSIKQRNRRVETDKAWETSWTRKLLIVLLTYIFIVLFFYFAGLSNPLINAIIPTLAFIISTLTLTLFKDMWIKYIYK